MQLVLILHGIVGFGHKEGPAAEFWRPAHYGIKGDQGHAVMHLAIFGLFFSEYSRQRLSDDIYFFYCL